MPGVVAANSLAAALIGGHVRPTWASPGTLQDRRFTCGYCVTFVGPHQGYYTSGLERIYICPSCGQPVATGPEGYQFRRNHRYPGTSVKVAV